MTSQGDRVLELLDAVLAAVPGAQQRQGQRDMASAVDRALRRREHLLVQAGTGTGKSLAYLVPALACGRRVVVATATRALQAQLVDKDLPRVVAALAGPLGRRPTWALAKGRGNYLCLQQAHGGPGAVSEPEGLFERAEPSGLAAEVRRLREWAGSTDTGDRDEVPFPVSERAWRQVSVSARDCLGRRCPDLVDCFAEKAREAAREVDVVVANHALLALDAFTGVSVLPEHDVVVLDEAHEFAASATEALTSELGRVDLRRAVTAAGDLLGVASRDRLQAAADALEVVLGALQPGWLRVLPEELRDVLALVESAAGAAGAEVGRDAGTLDEAAVAQRDRARSALGEVAQAAGELRAPSVPSATYAVGEPGSLRLRVSPLGVAGALSARLFGEVTVVATSATLFVGGSAAHTAGSLGLTRTLPDEDAPAHRWRDLDVGTPFDPGRQGQLWVARELPPPASPDWAPAVDALLVELVEAAGGRTLGLFSSSAAAARAAAAVRAARPDLPVLLQGDDSAGALAHRFASDARTCLFGTRSFWQGVDTPGSACQLVVIDRIPFTHVDDPLVQARLEAAGPSGFRTVTLPPAAVLLAQGAGRLLRAASDRGVVAVLDPRLATAGYASLLMATLPPFYRARSREAVLASLRAIDASAPPVHPVGPPPSRRRAPR